MKATVAVMLAIALAFSVASQALATGCFEPCPDGEVYSDEAEMCVQKSEAFT
ncbi:MAG: hypothetical protein ACR2PA_01485 [Hyphomicrobiaceae bacterium]